MRQDLSVRRQGRIRLGFAARPPSSACRGARGLRRRDMRRLIRSSPATSRRAIRSRSRMRRRRSTCSRRAAGRWTLGRSPTSEPSPSATAPSARARIVDSDPRDRRVRRPRGRGNPARARGRRRRRPDRRFPLRAEPARRRAADPRRLHGAEGERRDPVRKLAGGPRLRVLARRAGRTSPTPISAAPPRRFSPRRSTIRATSFSRGRSVPPTSPCARGRSRRPQRQGSGHGLEDRSRPDRRERANAPQSSLAGVRPAVVQIDPVPRISIQAFCESVEASAVVAAAAADRRMAKAQVKQNMGGAAAALEAYRNAATPNVIVLEAPADPSALIDQLDQLAQQCDPGTKVVVLGRANDVALYRQLIARGVSEYLVAAVRGRGLRPGDLPAFPRARARSRSAASSPWSAPRAASARRPWRTTSPGRSPRVADKATIVADFDLAFGTAGLDYNQDPPQSVADAVFAPERVDAVFVDRLLSKCGDNLSLLAAPATLDRVLDFSEPPSTRSSTRCALRPPGSWSTCRTSGPDGRAAR